jgi:hypothetical protein
MHIRLDEAIALLNSWKTDEIVLDIHVSRAGHNGQLQATVTGIDGAVVDLNGPEGEMHVDLSGAEFNGDQRAPANSSRGAYLICEYPKGDRWSFYAPRSSGFEPRIPAVERRRRF